MRFVLWLIKIALFMLVLSFAVKNTDPVTVRYYLGVEWQAPLIFVLLVLFCGGVVVGILASLFFMFRQRREIVALKRELRAKAHAASDAAAPPVASDAT
ncbi:MAG: LapA family protein [Betaproteobacteria bacterium]|nr:LapA family protein [Betaproteobacteria bacterium]